VQIQQESTATLPTDIDLIRSAQASGYSNAQVRAHDLGVRSTFQAGDLSPTLLTEETNDRFDDDTWSRMTAETAKAPHQTAAGL